MQGKADAAPAFAAFIVMFLVMVVEARLLLMGNAWWLLVALTMPLVFLVFRAVLGRWLAAFLVVAVFVAGVLAARWLIANNDWYVLVLGLVGLLSLFLVRGVLRGMRTKDQA